MFLHHLVRPFAISCILLLSSSCSVRSRNRLDAQEVNSVDILRTVEQMETVSLSLLKLERLGVEGAVEFDRNANALKTHNKELANLRTEYLLEYRRRLDYLQKENPNRVRAVFNKVFRSQKPQAMQSKLEILKVIQRHYELQIVQLPPPDRAILQDIEALRFMGV
jgi:hypothetical protein